MKKFYRLIAVILVIFTAVLLVGCSDNGAAKSVDSDKPKTSASTSYNQNQVNPNTVEAVQDEEAENVKEENKTVIDFGTDTIFGGIEVASDENGEIICEEYDGALWYKVTDERFPTYKKLSRFVYNSMGSSKGSKFMSSAKNYFMNKDDSLYFVNGINGRTVKSRKSYLLNDSDATGALRLTVSVSHTNECKKKIGIGRSHIDFVKMDGQWKIEDLTLFLDE